MSHFRSDDDIAVVQGDGPFGAEETRILGNGLMPGDRLPSEATLSVEFDVSRAATREILGSPATMPFFEMRRSSRRRGSTSSCSRPAPSGARGPCRAGRWSADRLRGPNDRCAELGPGRVASPRSETAQIARAGRRPVERPERGVTAVPAASTRLSLNASGARAGERTRHLPHQASLSRDGAAGNEGRDDRAATGAALLSRPRSAIRPRDRNARTDIRHRFGLTSGPRQNPTMEKRMTIPMIAMVAVAPLMAAASASDSTEFGLNGELARQSASPNVLQLAERKGFEDACGLVEADCRTDFVQFEGSDDGRGANSAGPSIELGAIPIAISFAYEKVFVGAVARPEETDVGAIRANPDDREVGEGDARQASEFQGIGMAASGIGEANSGNLPKEGSNGEVADIPMSGRNCSMARVAGDADFFEESGDSVATVVGENLIPRPPDTRAGENSVDQLQIVAGACAMRIDP